MVCGFNHDRFGSYHILDRLLKSVSCFKTTNAILYLPLPKWRSVNYSSQARLVSPEFSESAFAKPGI
jgi:hypothetical protein